MKLPYFDILTEMMVLNLYLFIFVSLFNILTFVQLFLFGCSV